jgi:EF hand
MNRLTGDFSGRSRLDCIAGGPVSLGRASPIALLLIVVLGVASGCRQGQERVPGPQFAPDAVAARAVSALDEDGNGALSRDELIASPGLLASLSIFDADGDGRLTRDELAAKLREWKDQKAGLISVECELTWKGQPLKGATVSMIPEPFFDGAIPAATGETDDFGQAELSCGKAFLPERLKSLRVVMPGIYRVEVTHPGIKIPPEYNSSTRLGRSVSLRNAQPLVLEL